MRDVLYIVGCLAFFASMIRMVGGLARLGARTAREAGRER